MKLFSCARAAIVVAAMVTIANGATVVMQALSSFGGGDGWLATGEAPPDMSSSVLTAGNTERGLAYSRNSNHLYVASRAEAPGHIYVLDATTGNRVGELNIDFAIVNGGLFTLNMVRVGADGAIYVGNLTDNTGSASKPFKVYRWIDEASQPELVFSGDGGLATPSTRLGDTLDVIGGGANTLLVAGYGNTTAITGENGYYLIRPDVANPTASAVLVNGTGDGDFRSGVTFLDEFTVWGTSGGSGVRRTKYSGTVGGVIAGTLEGTLNLTGNNERAMDYAVINGVPLLATIESSTGNRVHIYDVSDPAVRLELASMDLSTFFTTNANGTGSIAWGNISGNTATLYAMNTNNGIQAFSIQVVPEPAGAALLIVAAGFVQFMRRRPPFSAQTSGQISATLRPVYHSRFPLQARRTEISDRASPL